MKKLIITITNLLLVIIVTGQVKDKILDSNIRMQTEVFELDTKEPTQLSFVRKYDNNIVIKKIPVRKLETPVSRFTAFKIKNINPLRYNYFINDELVTQFMDPNPTLSASALSNGLVPVGDISTLSIFNFINKPIDVKEQVVYAELKASIKEIKSKISRNYNELKKLEDRQNAYTIKSKQGKDSIIKSKQKDYDRLGDSISINNSNYYQLSDDLESKLQEGLNIVSKLNIKSYATLYNLPQSLLKFKNTMYTELKDVANNLEKAVEEANKETKIFKEVEILLRKVLNNVPSNSYDLKSISNFKDKKGEGLYKNLDTLNQKLNEVGFYSQVIPQLLNSVNSKTSENIKARQKIIEEIIDITDFISLKKSKGLEDFLLNAYLEIGKLLQIQYTQTSRVVNGLKAANYIDNTDDIDNAKASISQTFTFIQFMSADFGIITRSLKVDDTQFKDIVNNITVNYFKLLDYLKKLDFVSKNNIVEYSLPTHNNLRNIDLIRYKIDRQDVINNSKQTYVYDLWLKGGIKIDFSVGIMGTALTNREFTKLATLTGSSSDSVLLHLKDKGMFNYAFGGMVNIYRRNGAAWLNWGGSLGIVYSETQKLQFLLGGTIHLGKTERILIHGGIAMGFINDIDESQLSILRRDASGKNFKELVVKGTLTNFNIPTLDRFTVKPFIGISYNLSKKNALQAVSSQAGYKYYNSELNPSTTTTSN